MPPRFPSEAHSPLGTTTRSIKVKTNNELVEDVTDELFFDPRIADISGIALSAENGAITLRGTVGSFHQKRAAAAAARRVRGVLTVDNELQVRLMTEARRDDAEIRAAALQALMLDSLVPADRLDVKVSDGSLTLTGNVSWQYQRDAADADVASVLGIVDIDDQVLVDNEPSAVDVADRINEAFARNAQLYGASIDVSSDGDSVTLSGSVVTWAQHDEAIDAAWSAPGVSSVRDQVEVVY
jgi:osmotically-inducible protein OsmY